MNPNLTALQWPAAMAVALFLLGAATGCGVDGYSRNVEFTHWHDDETVIIVYTREQTIGSDLATLVRPSPETTHVRICTVQEDNSLRCKHQRRLTNALNPDTAHQIDLDDRWRP